MPVLPSALDALHQVGRPEFLYPEATRQIPTSALHGRAAQEAAAAAAAAAAAGSAAGESRHADFGRADADISKMAPKLKGQQQ